MKLYLVRHAQSKRNAKVHSEADADITDVGKEQARRLGSYFHNVKVDHIYCSKLKRAKATLAKIKPYLKGIPVTYMKNINEMCMGVHEENGKDDWSTYFKEAIKEKGDEYHLYRPKNGESLQDVYDRAGRFYKLLLEKHPNDSVLVVGHGIFSLYLIFNILGLDLMEGKFYQLSNASISNLEITPKGKVKKFHINDYQHLILEAIRMKNKK